MLRRRLIGRLICSLLLLVFFGASLIARADQVDDYITAQMREQHIPGLSLAVIRDGRIVKMQGYGLANVEEQTPATPQTVYHLASLTKQFMGAAIVLLAQDGKLGLDDPISRYLEKTPARWSEITIRQLLTHTSGIKDYLNEMQSVTCNGTNPAEIISHLGEMPLNFAPGTAYAYSNTGYLVLDLIVQKVASETYDQFLGERIFRPLGMTETRRNSLSEIIPYRASGYVWTDGKLRNSPFVEPTLYDNGDDGLVSSVVDLARWDAALDTDNLLKADSQKQMYAPVSFPDGSNSGYGLGWSLGTVNGHRLVYHSGGRPDTSTFIARFLDDHLTIIVLTNKSGAGPSRIARHLAGLYNPALTPAFDKPIRDTEPQVTEMIKAVLLKIQSGAIDSAPFTEKMWHDINPNVLSYLNNFFKSYGAFKSIMLLAREEKGAERVYHYEAIFGDTNLTIDFNLTKEGKISEMGVAVE